MEMMEMRMKMGFLNRKMTRMDLECDHRSEDRQKCSPRGLDQGVVMSVVMSVLIE